MKKLIPILLAVIGTAAGVGAGLLLMPAAPPADDLQVAAHDCPPPTGDKPLADAHLEVKHVDSGPPEGREYVKMNNQFVVPVMGADRVQALVVASLSIEVAIGTAETVYAREPKLRDAFLQVLFDHANIGGFEGTFTNGERMKVLRHALLEAARHVLGADVSDILITEIARQDA
jgi:hypothetical protein